MDERMITAILSIKSMETIASVNISSFKRPEEKTY